VRLLLKKQHPGSRQPHSATTLKKWRGEESPSVLRRRGCQPDGLNLNPSVTSIEQGTIDSAD
ncbi:MAG: hypothetical protein EWV84_14145, partial [Microcystis sp. M_QC_C_20170808_M3Col]